MKILASEKLSEHKFKDNNGYLICTDCILSRTGKQTYRRDEVFKDGSNEEIEVDRLADEVFSKESLASFENCPVCINHPDRNVGPENHNELSVGFVRNVRQGDFEGQPVMMGDLVITDAKAIDLIESGDMVELSCGYDCDIDDEDNPQQKNIRGNHVALCEQGRAGIARIVDSIEMNDSAASDVVTAIKNMGRGFKLNQQRSSSDSDRIISHLSFVSPELTDETPDRVATNILKQVVYTISKLGYSKKYGDSQQGATLKNTYTGAEIRIEFRSSKGFMAGHDSLYIIVAAPKIKDSIDDLFDAGFKNEVEVLRQKGNKTLIWIKNAKLQPYVIVNHYDPRTESWEHGSYYSDYNQAKRDFERMRDSASNFEALKKRIQNAKSRRELKEIMVEVDAHKDDNQLSAKEYRDLIRLSENLKDSITTQRINKIIDGIYGGK